MNVSMMDSYNLSWKLAHCLNGLTPYPPGSADNVLNTYEIERQTVAQQLIAFDKEFSSMFSGKIGAENDKESLTHEQFLEVFSTGNGFTSGCGIEYPENLVVEKGVLEGVIEGKNYLNGTLQPGRRLLNVKVKRHADGVRRDFQDGIYPLFFSFQISTDKVQTFLQLDVSVFSVSRPMTSSRQLAPPPARCIQFPLCFDAFLKRLSSLLLFIPFRQTPLSGETFRMC